MKRFSVLLSALVALASCASTPQDLFWEITEFSEIEAHEAYIEHQEKFIQVATKTLAYSDEDFKEFVEKCDGSLPHYGSIISPTDTYGWTRPTDFPDFISLCRDKDISLAKDLEEAYYAYLKALSTFDIRWSDECEDDDENTFYAVSSNPYFTMKKSVYVTTELGACEYECELAMAEMYIDYLELHTELAEQHGVTYLDNAIEMRKDPRFLDIKSKNGELRNIIYENKQKILDLTYQLESRFEEL